MAVEIIDSDALAKKIINKSDTFILDVRNTEEFEDWKIEGEHVQIMNEPYFNLLDDVSAIEEKISKNQEVIVVCAKGGSSQLVGELLDDAGFTNVFSLEGGMKAWSEHLEPVKIADLKGGGELFQFVRLGKGCLSYFISSEGEAAVIDPSRMIDVYQKFAEERNVQITHIIDTHLHADHISGGKSLADEVNGTYYLPPGDATDVTYRFEALEERSQIQVGSATVNVQPIYSPGHTPGSTSLIIDEAYLLTGDILFVASIGRPDLAGKADAWAVDLQETLFQRFIRLPEELLVLPAHYAFVKELKTGGEVSAPLGKLYEKNPGLQLEDEREFRRMLTENLPQQPNAYDKIRQTNMGKFVPDHQEKNDMELGPNRCAIHE
ncbi:MBL fold metallo-hydrolase [Thalassobacillus sp. CUG 92003]|uniref:MBL fold metallo-hydrolase n=1 Tax=Thalassobacillus sp. CUG 92003 TaxID=2736641 RepID=UPI0015E6ECBE|nr:MBL fold metallo-hydrolase [Thalassobacillus sp. CUG 92003]